MKQTDYNGAFEYSDAKSVTVDAGSGTNLVVYPNPTNGIITLIGDSPELEEVKVFNALGQDLTSEIRSSNNDTGDLVLDLSNMAAGLSYVKTGTRVTKVFKQ